VADIPNDAVQQSKPVTIDIMELMEFETNTFSFHHETFINNPFRLITQATKDNILHNIT
jgi:hypothetical protein